MEVATRWINKGQPVSRVCRICDVPRSTYYYHKNNPERQKPAGKGRPIPGYSYNRDGHKVSDKRIKNYLLRLIEGPDAAFGYRKLTVLLRRKYKLIINKKKVYRLCKELKILAPQREIKNPVPKRVANNRVVTAANQVWQMDIKYGYVVDQRRHFFVASIIDVFDRSIVAHHRGKSCTAHDVIKTLQKALLKRSIHTQAGQLVIRTDNGPQFISKAFHAFCEQGQIEHERIPNQMPNKNAYIESFHSILERECFLRNCFETFEEAFTEVDRFMRYYNNRRIHGSLEDWPPKIYLEKVLSKEIQPKKIAL